MFRVYHTRIMTGALILSSLQTIHGMRPPSDSVKADKPALPDKPTKWFPCWEKKVKMKKTQNTNGRKQDHSAFDGHKIDYRYQNAGKGPVEFRIQKRVGRHTPAFKIKYILFGKYNYDRYSYWGTQKTYLVFTINIENSNPKERTVKDRHIILGKFSNLGGEDVNDFDWGKYKSSWHCLIKILQLLKETNQTDWIRNIPELGGDNIYNRLITGEQYFDAVVKRLPTDKNLKKKGETLINNIKKDRRIARFKKMISFLKLDTFNLAEMFAKENLSKSETRTLKNNISTLHSVLAIERPKTHSQKQASAGSVAKDVESKVRNAADALEYAERQLRGSRIRKELYFHVNKSIERPMQRRGSNAEKRLPDLSSLVSSFKELRKKTNSFFESLLVYN